jgi:hypothetical protein
LQGFLLVGVPREYAIGGSMSGGGQPGNSNARTHGASSETGLRGRKTKVKRLFLRARGLRESDLSAAVRSLLDDYAGLESKVAALDEWFDEHGLLDEKGEPHAPTRLYIAVVNSRGRALDRLEAQLPTPAEPDYFDRWAD